MINFNAGASRQANDDARSDRVSAANDLVRRTLSQHGLWSGPVGASSGPANQGGSGLENLVSGLTSRLGPTVVQPDPIPDGAEFRQDQFSCAAGTRSYRTYVPSTAETGVTGVVMMLHGCTQSPEDFAKGTGMNALAEAQGFVVVYPLQTRGDNAQSCWNWFSRGDQQRDRGEPAILAGITRAVMAEFDVGSDRCFVAGLSAGAAMAVILGETYPDLFAAVGAHSGLPFGAAKDVPSAFAAMAGTAQELRAATESGSVPRSIIFHGTADPTVHPSNGDRIARRAMDRRSREVIETVVENDVSGRRFNRKVASTNGGPAEVEYWTVEGLGHAWSGGRPGGSFVDQQGPDASAEIIRFFFQTDGAN